MRTSGRLGAVASSLLVLVVAHLASAAEPLVQGTSLSSRLGVKRAESLLASESREDRIQGLERLGATASPRAMSRLIDVLEPGGRAASPEERLTAVRALAPHAREPEVRRALARVAGGYASPLALDGRPTLDRLSQRSAALALARAGTPEAITALARELDGSADAAEAAVEALVAYPPRDLGPLLRAAPAPTERLVQALDALSDQRGFARLRELVRSGAPNVRARAAIALTHLGDYETVELARRWLASETPPELRIAAAEILAIAHAPDAPEATKRLLAEPSTASAGIELALRAPSVDLVPSLTHLLVEAATDEARATTLIVALGRAGGTDAALHLERLLGHSTRSAAVADALGRMPGAAAGAALTRALGRPGTARAALNAATIRWLTLREIVPGYPSAALRASRSNDPADRAAGMAALVAQNPERAEALLGSTDRVAVESAAALLLIAPERAAEKASERLRTETDPTTRSALALSLAFRSVEESVPHATLAALVDARGAASPLAARALAARSTFEPGAEADELLEHAETSIRAHAALGLGRNPDARAVGRLSRAYRFETDGAVRLAIVTALGARSEPTRLATLRLAETLDGTEAVRALARRALLGERLEGATRGPAAGLFRVTTGAALALRSTAISIRVPGGLALPASTGPQGLVIVAGLSKGLPEVRVAPGEKPDDDSTRGDRGDPQSNRIERSRKEP